VGKTVAVALGGSGLAVALGTAATSSLAWGVGDTAVLLPLPLETSSSTIKTTFNKPETINPI
jgi:hypothetical protein